MSSTNAISDFAARWQRLFALSGTGGQEPSERSADEFFGTLALELFGIQFTLNAPYRRFCEARGARPGTVGEWTGVPAIPVAAFKEFDLSCLPEEARTTVFHSSGTTGRRPGRHFHDARSLAAYEASLWPWFRENVLEMDGEDHRAPGGVPPSGEGAGCTPAPRLAILTPPPAQVPHSSLVYMFEIVRRELGAPESVFLGRAAPEGGWLVDVDAAVAMLEGAARANRRVLVLGTAFSFVHLLEELARRRLRFELPAASRAVETGGYKGRARALPKGELHALITRHLGIPRGDIVCEYGMSELSSQAYDSPVRAPRRAGPAARCFRFPPWARARIISPETGAEVGVGETGLIQVYDLANVASVISIQTEDLGVRREGGLDLIGRAALAEPRGCSLAAA